MFASEIFLLVSRSLEIIERLLPWLATYAVHSTVLILLAALVTSRRAPWRLGTGARDLVWKCAMVGGLATASLQMMIGAVPLGGTWNLRPQNAASTQDLNVVVTATPDSTTAPLIGGSGVVAAKLQHPSLTLSGANFTMSASVPRGAMVAAMVVMLWLSGLALTALRYDHAQARLQQMLRRRVLVDHTPAGAVLQNLAARAHVPRAVHLSASDWLISPAAIDGSEICVPQRFLTDVNLFEQESILAHELAHLVRRDVMWLKAGHVVVNAFFFQPLNRLALAKWRENAEFAADEWAVRMTRAPLLLARGLAAVASWLTRPSQKLALPTMASERGSVLVRRVARLTGQDQAPGMGNSRPSRVAVAVLATLAGVIAMAPRIEMSPTTSTLGFRRVVFEERVQRDGAPGHARQLRVVRLTEPTGVGLSKERTIVVRTATGAATVPPPKVRRSPAFVFRRSAIRSESD